ncbi:MAG: hypothetical protein M1833_002026 [Piccolia ochrophora]|nr:MAG: hypothetical protein M1833_002026 [Piccolia ochrophora]
MDGLDIGMSTCWLPTFGSSSSSSLLRESFEDGSSEYLVEHAQYYGKSIEEQQRHLFGGELGDEGWTTSTPEGRLTAASDEMRLVLFTKLQDLESMGLIYDTPASFSDIAPSTLEEAPLPTFRSRSTSEAEGGAAASEEDGWDVISSSGLDFEMEDWEILDEGS